MISGVTPSRSSLLVALVLAAMRLTAVGFIAIGVSGFVDAAMGAAFGWSFVAGAPPGVTYTAELCAAFLRAQPGAGDCMAAALADHYEGTTVFRVFVGVLGLLLGGVTLVAARGARRIGFVAALPPSLAPGIGAAAFGGATVLFGGLGLSALLYRSPGAGQFLSAAIVSAPMCAWYTASLWRALRGA